MTKICKPTEVDASLRYICPNIICKFDHWLFLRETKTKNFKIVCDCGTVFKPKLIKKIQLVYAIPESGKKRIDKEEKLDKIDVQQECVIRAVRLMVSLGYSRIESEKAVVLIYESEGSQNYKDIAKKAISKIGGI